MPSKTFVDQINLHIQPVRSIGPKTIVTIAGILSAFGAYQYFTSTKTSAQIVAERIGSTGIVQNGHARGSGWFIDDRADFITAHHVITQTSGAMATSPIPPFERPLFRVDDTDAPKAPTLQVVNQGKTYDAKVIYDDPEDDVAILHVEGLAHTTGIPWGNIKKVRSGDEIIEIGDPFDVGLTVTRGVVSNTQAGLDNLATLQYDAPTNPGNSGGVILNVWGQAIGMCDEIKAVPQMFGPSQSSGLAFAVPSNRIRNKLRTLDFF